MCNRNNYFVGFIDVLGFSNLITNATEHTELISIYNSLRRSIHAIPDVHRTGQSNEFLYLYSGTPGRLPPHTDTIFNNVYNFSDSIIFYIKCCKDLNDNINRLSSMCWIMNAFIAESIITDPRLNQFALRGAIAYGPAIMDRDNRIHIGKPLIDAYYLSNNQEWMGGALHPTVPEEMIGSILGHDKQLFEYEVPTKDEYNEEIKCALKWVQQHPCRRDLTSGNRRPRVEDIGKSHVMKKDWGTQIHKRDNTMNFVRNICNEYDSINS